jgi:hypothetical protein
MTVVDECALLGPDRPAPQPPAGPPPADRSWALFASADQDAGPEPAPEEPA